LPILTSSIIVLGLVHVLLTWMVVVRQGLQARGRGLPQSAEPRSVWPGVSILVPAWMERGTIEACVASLQELDYPFWEVIIIAGGPDGTLQAATNACAGMERFQVIEQPPRGKNAALNLGLRAASNDTVVVLDADSRVSHDWLKSLIAPLRGGIQATTGNFRPLRETPISLGEQMECIVARGIARTTDLQGSGAIAIRRETIALIGGFPEDVLVGVDWELDVRLTLLDVPRAFCPDALIFTERPATVREYWRNEVRWRCAHFSSLFRHPARFLASPVAALRSLYIYALAWFAVLATLVVAVVALATRPPASTIALVLWTAFIGWILLRRAALAGEVAAYTGDSKWLMLSWVPPLLLCVTFVAIVPATLTVRRQQAHFKGPRTHRIGNHAG
jgi:cellulose synthase/poly-beta-1,6-N-acetylglucosamine synthase-like glycosyltransferase